MAASLQIKKVNWWHERLADWMIANPDKSLREAATVFNCTPSHISIIKNSDVFQDYWKQRSLEASGLALAGVQEKSTAVAELALDAMAKRLEAQAEVLPLPVLLDVLDVTMKRFGYSSKKDAPGPTVNINFNQGLVSKDELAQAREKMASITSLHAVPSSEKVQAIDAEILSSEAEEPPGVSSEGEKSDGG